MNRQQLYSTFHVRQRSKFLREFLFLGRIVKTRIRKIATINQNQIPFMARLADQNQISKSCWSWREVRSTPHPVPIYAIHLVERGIVRTKHLAPWLFIFFSLVLGERCEVKRKKNSAKDSQSKEKIPSYCISQTFRQRVQRARRPCRPPRDLNLTSR